MTAVDRFLIAVIAGAFVGLVVWAMAVLLGPGLMGLAFGGLTAVIYARAKE